MKRGPLLATLLVGAACLSGAAYSQTPAPLPPGPGLVLVNSHCTTCHGLDFITKQPRGKGSAFWAASVSKMIDTHGAEIPPEDAKAIIAYLGRTFG